MSSDRRIVAQLAAAVARVARPLTGSVFCPRCGWRIGRADSPTISYQRRCNGCGRAIAIAIEEARVRIVVEDPTAEH